MAQIAPVDANAQTLAVGGATATDPRALRAAFAVPKSIAEGTWLDGRYRIVRFLAAGGMGEVYEARDQLLEENVAIKLMRRDLVGKPGARERFADEIRMARKVTHFNVCRVFDVGADGDRVFYTMELHAGDTLASRLDRDGKLTVDQIRPIAAQILAAIGAAHTADVIHADLKPSNVLLEPNGRVLVTDFGLAMWLCASPSCECKQTHLLGTPAYMSPEQVEGNELARGTDLFAFGVILFEMLTGELPWCGSNALELASARLTGPTPSPRAIDPSIDPTWDAVVQHCLSRDRDGRPASAAEVVQALALA
jgi:eukaryotic-like serine/threonine-protein kinase